MEVVGISSGIIEAKELNHINASLAKWDLSAVEGEALFIGSMHSKYAHVKIKMYAPSDDSSRIIWNVPETELPLEFRGTITKGLEFFLGYLAGIKGQSISLAFEINDGSYHPVDSNLLGFNLVTTRAIIDCFDPDYSKFDAQRIFRKTSFRGHDAGL
ncbi:hypothetical protein [Pedobacter polysacchareus]|uniref:hypothetical protein n=1 Tax=Pedobacter polysacchareus TaxID=2861973 RepID=UPI001C99E10E|nr:hypothetical protein [Pedobacter polysacchareus]